MGKYRSAQSATENPRQTEYRLFAEVTKALLHNKGKSKPDPELIKAVDWNRRLWLTLQSDVMSDDNVFPDDLKAAIISLAIWVEKQSRKAMRGEAPLDPLISINRTIMEGLAIAAG